MLIAIGRITLFLTLIAFCELSFAQSKTKIEQISPLSIGEKVTIRSQTLKESRVLNIYLPNSYSKLSTKNYPVIYLLDGSIDEDFIHIAGLVQFGSFSWIKMLPESIVVGIGNVDRRRDFTYPSSVEREKKDFPTSGGSKKFAEFIEQEIQPLVRSKYRTMAGNETLIGQSLGGLVATEILFKNPDLFDNYIIVSPSLWWDRESLLKFEPKTYSSKKSVFVAVGKEGEVMERLSKDLYSKLNGVRRPNTRLFFEFLKEQDHGDTLHLAVYKAFEQIFSTKESKTP